MKIRLKLNPVLRPPPLEPGDRRFWLLGVLAIRRVEGVQAVWRLEFFWKRFLVLATVLAGVGYLVAATALWAWFRRTPQNKVTWVSVALAPVQRERFRTLRGETSIAVALERLRTRDYVEGFHGLRAGLARAPGHVEGRIVLATLLAGNDPARALATLEEGLAQAPDSPELLRALFALYQQQQVQGRALQQARELLARQPPLSEGSRRLVAAARASILADQGEWAAAAQALAELPPAPEALEADRGALLRISVLIKLGQLAEAKAEIDRRVVAGQATPEVFRLQAEHAIAVRDDAALEGALRRLRAAGPDSPQAYLYTFQAWHRARRLTLRDRAEQEYYQLFGAQDAAMQVLAATAAGLDLPEVVQRAQQVAQRHRLSPFAFRVHLTEMALRRGDFDAAFRYLREWEGEVDTLKAPQRAYPQLVSLLARASIGGATQPTAPLLAHLGEMRGRATPPVFTFVSSVLELGGHPEAAREAIGVGLRLYPHHDVMRAEERRLAGVIAKRAEIAADRRDASTEKRELTSVPATAEESLAQLDRLFSRGELVAAGQQLRAVRAARPIWLASAEAELKAYELHLALLSQDPPTARTLIRTYLEQHHREQDALGLVAMAGQMLTAGKANEARLLHDEVLRARGSMPAVAARLKAMGLGSSGDELRMSPERALAAIDEAMRRKDPEHALFLIEEARRVAPDWLATGRGDLGIREVRVRLALDQRPTALFLLRDLTLKSEESRAIVLKAVRTLADDGDERTALLLAREVVKLLPGDATAAQLLQELEAPRPGGDQG